MPPFVAPWRRLAGDRAPVEIACRTTYPFEETIRFEISPQRTAQFPLYFRIPVWCGNART